MNIAKEFKPERATLGAALLALGGLAEAKLASILPNSVFATALAYFLYFGAFVLTVFAFVQVARRRCIILSDWTLDAVLKGIEQMKDREELRFMNCYVPEMETLLPALREICIEKGKNISIKVLLFDFVLAPYLIEARLRYRKDNPGEPSEVVQKNIRQFLELKAAIKTAEKPANVTVRLYDHIPIGGYYQVGDRLMQLAFFYTTRSGQAGHALLCDGINCKKWRLFAKNFEESWRLARTLNEAELSNA